jgi:hypothetical protein
MAKIKTPDWPKTQRWRGTGAIILDHEQTPHRFLRLGHGVEVAHSAHSSHQIVRGFIL